MTRPVPAALTATVAAPENAVWSTEATSVRDWTAEKLRSVKFLVELSTSMSRLPDVTVARAARPVVTVPPSRAPAVAGCWVLARAVWMAWATELRLVALLRSMPVPTRSTPSTLTVMEPSRMVFRLASVPEKAAPRSHAATAFWFHGAKKSVPGK